jgi:hypothetical protein
VVREASRGLRHWSGAQQRLERLVEPLEARMLAAYAQSGVKQREIDELRYAADSWDKERRVITRLEYGSQGTKPMQKRIWKTLSHYCSN